MEDGLILRGVWELYLDNGQVITAFTKDDAVNAVSELDLDCSDSAYQGKVYLDEENIELIARFGFILE